MEDLDRGLIDFALLFWDIDSSKYESIDLPSTNHFGVLMGQKDSLAKKEVLTPEDLLDKPLIVATYNLLLNGSIMVDEGMGYALGLDKIINSSSTSNLCYRPLSRQFDIKMSLAWKKYQVFAKAAEKFQLQMQEAAREEIGNP